MHGLCQYWQWGKVLIYQRTERHLVNDSGIGIGDGGIELASGVGKCKMVCASNVSVALMREGGDV